jgi:hypothetical protein
MDYGHVASDPPPSDLDEDEDIEATVIVPPSQGLDCKHRMLYTCLGAFLSAKLLFVCWIISQSVSPEAVTRLFHWGRE